MVSIILVSYCPSLVCMCVSVSLVSRLCHRSDEKKKERNVRARGEPGNKAMSLCLLVCLDVCMCVCVCVH